MRDPGATSHALVGIRGFPRDRHRPGQAGRPLRRPCLRGEAHAARSVAPAAGADALSLARRPPAGGDDRGGLSGLLPRVQRAGHGPAVRAADAPAVAARRPRRPLPDHAHDARPGGEHRAQLLDHDDLAGVRRRDDPALPDPGRRAGVAELPRRGGRAGGGRGVHPRVRPRAVGDARQLLGRPGPGAAVGAAAPVAGGQPRAGLAGGAAQRWPRTSWRRRSRDGSR